MTWQQIIAVLEAGLAIAGQVDPAIAATTEEISALTSIATKVAGVVSAQSGVPIATVIAGLTPEDPIV